MTTLAGVGLAAPAQAMRPTDGPGSGATDTTKIDDVTRIPAGYACNVGIKIHYTATETDAYSLDGKTITVSSPNARATFTNLKTHKSIHRVVDGAFIERLLSPTRLMVVGGGRNFYFGEGTRGVLIEGGFQRFRVTHAGQPHETVTFLFRTGPREQVCHTLGARAVPGRNLAPSSSPQGATAVQMRGRVG